MTASSPRFVFLEVTSTCNLRCGHCHLWQSAEPPDSLTTAEKVRLIDDLAGWVDRAVVVLTGGETMAKREEFFSLSQACRRGGLSSSANTNGTFIDDATVPRLLEEGPKYLVLSLDSHHADVFDRTRGNKGTFDTVTRAIRALVAYRATLSSCDVRIMTSTVLFDENVGEVTDLVRFCHELGVDGMLFQPLARTFGLRRRTDTFFERHFPRDPAAWDGAVDQLLAMKSAGAPIETAVNDLNWMRLYGRDPDFVGEQVCGSADRNMMVDQMGRVQLCFRMHDLLGGRFLGNIREQSLRELWTADLAAEARGIMANCRQNCGMLNCHRRMEIG
jgi:MoaA/NifB/PqqE/SkfB family radical SAM enzyme